LSPANDYKTEQANLAEALRNFQRKTVLDLTLNATEDLQQEIQRLGASLFGLNGCQYFKQTGDGFVNNDILITSTKSVVSKAAETKSIISSTDTKMIVIDQQLMERSKSSTLLAIPILNDGDVTAILLAGLDSYDPTTDSQGLKIFAASISEATSKAPQIEQVSIDSVRRKAREITHEVNNPFSIVQNYLKILNLKLGEEHEAQKAIDTISSEIQRAAQILTRYNHIGDEEKQSAAPANSEEVILGLVEVFRTSYPSATFDLKLQSNHPLITLSDEKLKQVLVNLFKNAIEAMDSSGEIIVRTTDVNFPTTSYLELEVSDNGPGIAAEMRDNLFLPGTTTKTSPGFKNEESGLGLGIVNDIVSTNTGMISFQSDESGTCFRILLPQTSILIDSQSQSDRTKKETQ
jgi:signal transduction histidine kinase